MNERDGRLWCCGRASVHLDSAIAQLGDLVPCLENLEGEDGDLSDLVAQALRLIWRVRESMFEVVAEYDEADDEPPEGGP